MAVLFDNIPGNVKVPFFYAEFRSGGTPAQGNSRLLMIGQKLSAGAAPVGHPIMAREAQASGLAGARSMLARMDAVVRRIAPLAEVWYLPLADASAGVAATGKISVGAPTLSQPRVLTVYIAGRRVRVTALTADTRASIATKLAAEINAAPDLPVSAAINGTNNYEVDLAARHKGTLGNHIALEAGVIEEDGNLGYAGSEIVLTITAMANGAGDPEIAAALANLGDDMEFDWIVCPYTDTTNLAALTDYFSDVAGRWSWYRQLYGHATTPLMTDVASMQSFGLAQNRNHLSYFPTRKFISTPEETLAAVGARQVKHLTTAPELSRPLQTTALDGIQGPRSRADRLTRADRQTLLSSGISTYYIDQAGVVRIERIVTGYRVNAWGDADATYMDVETMAQSMFGIRYIRAAVTNAHGRQALADQNPGRLPHIATAVDVRNTIIHAYNDLVALGVFENPDIFARDLVVERDTQDPNRLNCNLPLDHVNQLRIVAAAAVNYMQRSAPRDALVAA